LGGTRRAKRSQKGRVSERAARRGDRGESRESDTVAGEKGGTRPRNGLLGGGELPGGKKGPL